MYQLLAETQPGGVSPMRWPSWAASVQEVLVRVEGAGWLRDRVAGRRKHLVSLNRREIHILTALLDQARTAGDPPNLLLGKEEHHVPPVSAAEIEALADRLRGDLPSDGLVSPEPLDAELEGIRAALQKYLDRVSLRELARQIGIAPTSVTNLINGTQPYRKTLVKLRSWNELHGNRTRS
jgi:hypothetical protein